MSPDELEPAVDAPQAAGAETLAPDAPEPAPAPAPGTVCRICAAPREDGQDWCLQCGTAYARPRSLGSLKSLGALTAATLVLMSGAAVASVAAINDKKPGPPTVVATVARSVAATTTAAPITPVTTPPDSAVTPLPVDTPVTPAPITPAPTTTTPTTTTPTTTTPAPTTTRILISSGAGALYDPLARAQQTGDPQRAIDGDPGTSWFVTTPPDGDMNVGYLIDLGEPTLLKKLHVFTKTPGMALRILGATSTDPPPSFDDSGWTEIAQEPDAGLDAKGHPRSSKLPVAIPLETNGKKFRLIAIAIKTPPLSGTTARFTELRLFG